MYEVQKINQLDISNDNGLIIGGKIAYGEKFPSNKQGEELLHLLSIDCNKLSSYCKDMKMPTEGYISVFTTYKENDYFLDLITEIEDCIDSCYTYVYFSFSNKTCESSSDIFIEKKYASLEKSFFDEDDYPMESFFAKKAPKNIIFNQKILNDYCFIGQLYSSLFIMKNKDSILGISDGIGYIFLHKDIKNSPEKGLFFVSA